MSVAVTPVPEVRKTVRFSLGADGRTLVEDDNGEMEFSGPASLVDIGTGIFCAKGAVRSIHRRLRVSCPLDSG